MVNKNVVAENFFDQVKLLPKSEESKAVTKISAEPETQKKMKNRFGGKVEEKFEQIPLTSFEKSSKREGTHLNDQEKLSKSKDRSKRKKSSSKSSNKKTTKGDDSQVRPITERQYDDLEQAQNEIVKERHDSKSQLLPDVHAKKKDSKKSKKSSSKK